MSERLDAIVQALESQLDDIKHFFDLSTGEVTMISEEFGEAEELDQQGDRFVLIPPLSNNERFQIMEDFVEMLSVEGLREELNMALIEKGAFQRFEEVLRKYPFEQWRRFRQNRIHAHARKWFQVNKVPLEPSQEPEDEPAPKSPRNVDPIPDGDNNSE